MDYSQKYVIFFGNGSVMNDVDGQAVKDICESDKWHGFALINGELVMLADIEAIVIQDWHQYWLNCSHKVLLQSTSELLIPEDVANKLYSNLEHYAISKISKDIKIDTGMGDVPYNQVVFVLMVNHRRMRNIIAINRA